MFCKQTDNCEYFNFCCNYIKHANIFGAAQKPQKVYYSFTPKTGLKLGFSTFCSGIIIICM